MNTQRKVQNLVVMALLIISGHATSNYSPEMAATLMRHYYPNMTTQETTAPVLQQLEYKQEPTASTVAITTPEIKLSEPTEAPLVTVKQQRMLERTTKPSKQKVTATPTGIVLEEQSFGKKLLEKTKLILNKPGVQLAAVAASAGAYALAKITKSALAEHADKTGTDKIKAVYGSLKTLGLGKFLTNTKSSFTQDASLKQALAFVAVDTLLELSTKGLSRLTQLA